MIYLTNAGGRTIISNQSHLVLKMDDDTVLGIIIDLCSRKFLLLSEEGQEKEVTCEDTDQFMRVLKVCTDRLDESQIQYADLSMREV